MKKAQDTDKLFVVRKFVKAKSVRDALKKEKNIEPDEVYLDGDWKCKDLPAAIGFSVEINSEEQEYGGE